MSTLTAKLKPDVARIAQVLLDGTYQRAAYIAHTKIAYPSKVGDFYDRSEDAEVGVIDRYGRIKKD